MFQNIVGALGTAFDGLAALILSLSYGFAAMPTSLGYAAAIAGMLVFGQVSPLSIQSETIILIGRIGKDREHRLSIAVFSGVVILVLGLTGSIGWILNFIGPDIQSAVMAGVGIMICMVAVNLIKEQPLPGIVSTVVSVGIYLLTDNLIYAVAGSVIVTIIIWNLFKHKQIKAAPLADLTNEKFKFTRITIDGQVIRGILAASTIMLGACMSDSSVNAQLAGTPLDINGVFTYIGAGNILSGLFGGSPVGVVISGTATAPDPLLSGILFMAIMIILVVTRIVPRIIRYIPNQAIAGFLLTLALFVVFPTNAAASLGAAPVIAGVTMLITAVIDPFFGMVAGVAMRYLILLVGMI